MNLQNNKCEYSMSSFLHFKYFVKMQTGAFLYHDL
jgi:hypothetical protein